MKYYSVTEVAKMFGFSRQTVLYWIDHGKIKAIRPFRDYRIPQSEIDRLRGEQ